MVKIDKKFYRPLDVNNIRGDYSKAKKYLGWKPETTLDELIEIMMGFENRET